MPLQTVSSSTSDPLREAPAPHFLFLVCPTSAQAVARREALAGSASSWADLPLPRLSPYLCCWALGSERGNHPRESMCPGSEPPAAVHQAPRGRVIHIFLFSCLQQERMKEEKKYPAACTVSLGLSGSSRAARLSNVLQSLSAQSSAQGCQPRHFRCVQTHLGSGRLEVPLAN